MNQDDAKKTQLEIQLMRLKVIGAALVLISTVIGILITLFSLKPKDPPKSTSTTNNNKTETTNIYYPQAVKNTPDPSPTKNKKPSPPASAAKPPKSPANKKPAAPNFSSFYNTSYKGDLILLEDNIAPSILNALKAYTNKYGLRSTTNFFRTPFLKKYPKNTIVEGGTFVDDFQINKHTNCICSIQQDIQYTPQKWHGRDRIIARGTVRIKVLNVKTGETSIESITTSGPGRDKPAALTVFAEHFQQLLEKNNALNLASCKR